MQAAVNTLLSATPQTGVTEWPAGFARVADEAWTRGPVDPRGRNYDAMGSHLWYRNLDFTLAKVAEHVSADDIVIDYSGGTGLFADRLLPLVPNAGVLIVDASQAFLRTAIEKLGVDPRVAFRLLRYIDQSRRLQRLDEVLGSELNDRVAAVVSTNAVHLYDNLPATFAAWHRVIRPGGKVFVQSAEIDDPAAPSDRWLITQFVDRMQAKAREIVLRDERYATYRPVLRQPERLATYDRLAAKIFRPVRPLQEYLDALQTAGFTINDVSTVKVPVGVTEWYDATICYPDLFAWMGGNEAIDGRPPSADALADRIGLMKRAVEEMFGEAETFDAFWTHITGTR
jgi:ubiquinone/menaquinone biosynthesis C-methylase UbiE